MIRRWAPVLSLLLVLPAQAQQQKKDPAAPKVDDAKVDAAIKKGIDALKGAGAAARERSSARELVLLALVHSGVRTGDPVFDELLRGMLAQEPEMTYRVALQAMVLEELDRAKYQRRIWQCAQALVDNQCQNGQWSYQAKTTYPEPEESAEVATGSILYDPNKVVIFGESEPGQKPAVKKKLAVKKQRDGPARGDNSNSQYALLGLRACHDAGIVIPKSVIEKAVQWWHESQDAPGKDTPTGSAPPRGWGYQGKGSSYGSMTAGAVGALTICDYILGVDWKKDANVNSGVSWLRENFTVTENPGRGNQWHYYYLYGLERAGMLYGTEKFGTRWWYFEGATFLLQQQTPDGGWGGSTNDTCFAILFLRRATRALTPSEK